MTIKVFFFGDSICFGQGVSLHRGWVPRISVELEKLATGLNQEVMVVNSAVNGRTTRQALQDMPYEIQSHAPDILLIQFGLNDCNYWETDHGNPRVSLKSFSANIEEIIDRATAFNVKKSIVITNHPTGRCTEIIPNTNITYQQSVVEYNESIRAVVSNYGNNCSVIDMEEVFMEAAGIKEGLNQYLLGDLLHLSEKGHDLYFNTINPILSDMISGLDSR